MDLGEGNTQQSGRMGRGRRESTWLSAQGHLAQNSVKDEIWHQGGAE